MSTTTLRLRGDDISDTAQSQALLLRQLLVLLILGSVSTGASHNPLDLLAVA